MSTLLRRPAAAAAQAMLLAASLYGGAAGAAVRVIVGPTPIVAGSANSAGDITVVNEKLAFALAVASPVPYGVPRGAIVDVAPVTDGTIGRDRVVFADFIPNNWSAWPNTYQHVDILEQTPARVVIRAVRDWAQVTITTQYTLAAGSDHVVISTTMRNDASSATPTLLSGLTLWPNSGHLFGVPGVAGMDGSVVGAPDGISSEGALADRVVAYDEGWSIALHSSGFTHLGDESMDLYRAHSLAPGATASFEGWLQVGSRGDLAPVMRADIERGGLPFGFVEGSVHGSDGRPIEQPVVVAEKNGKPYGWALGSKGGFAMTLPAGRYELYATARNHSQSTRVALAVIGGAHAKLDFGGLQRPGKIAFAISAARGGAPLDARIRIVTGQKPLVRYLGAATFFTALDAPGKVDVPIAPGDYTFEVSSGGSFFAEPLRTTLSVTAGATRSALLVLDRRFEPARQGWYCADLHHHADQAEAVTPPADLARSQLAAGLSLLFVSDHDSMVNFAALEAIATRRHVPLLRGMELSPSWGHFNAYPLSSKGKLQIDTSVASVDQIFAEARRLGATVIQANHPFIPYGYLSSVAGGVAPGGFNPAFELLEINAAAPTDDMKVLHALWSFWNRGDRYYLSAGTDTHNVWNDESGALRLFAHVDGPLTDAAFAHNLKEGHAYVSSGPLLYPSVPFGDVVKVKPGQSFGFDVALQSIAGLRQVELIGGGDSVRRETFPANVGAPVNAGAPVHEHTVHYVLEPAHSTWYSLIVEDAQGHKAYSNPVWVDVVDIKEALP